MAFTHRTLSASLAAITLAGLFSLPAAAQPNPPAPTPAAQASSEHPHHAQRLQKMQAHQAKRLDKMKTLLQLQPQQQAAWEQYTHSLQATKPQRAKDQQALQQMGTLERLDHAKQLRQARSAAAEQHDQATRAFYNSLNASQQKAFDTLHTHASPRGSKQAAHRHIPPHGPRGAHGGHTHPSAALAL